MQVVNKDNVLPHKRARKPEPSKFKRAPFAALFILCLPLIGACTTSHGADPQPTNSSPVAKGPVPTIPISAKDKTQIGKVIWKNECGGTVEGLTSWNEGEDFPSLGIGHFIWYRKGGEAVYEESFPPLIRFMEARGQKVPDWLEGAPPCPWRTREEFLAERGTGRLGELRQFLADTVPLQTEFLVARLQAALPKMLAEAEPAEREGLNARFYRVAGKGHGIYSLVDYVNFKGEGTNPSERYKGMGWGLLQVLQEMRDLPDAQSDFSAAADRVLTRRVANASGDESRWLKGWRNRCASYGRPLGG